MTIRFAPPDGVGSQRDHIIPIEELNGVSIALVARSGVIFKSTDRIFVFHEDHFNSFIDSSGLIDLPLGGRLFTWTNKVGTKLSKLDHFLIFDDVAEALTDARFTTIDHLWSGHNPILLYITKCNFGPTLFKLFHSWLLRDTFDEFIKMELSYLEEQSFGRKLISHEKFRFLKARIKQWHIKTKNSDSTIKQDNLQAIKSNQGKIEAESVNDIDRDTRIKLLQ
ncbi:RNA-directed DNA polymerase, eukaryota, reverse transcriptase zinc-binding domain protein [Tanacetum coccineum]